jgi:hypothetical protein
VLFEMRHVTAVLESLQRRARNRTGDDPLAVPRSSFDL